MLLLQEFLPYRLNRIASEMSMRTRAVYIRSYDLTMPEWRVLATLGQQSAQTAKAIGLQTYMHKTKVSRAVGALDDRRWIERHTNPADRREELLSLNPRGRKSYESVAAKLEAFQTSLYAGLGSKLPEVLDLLSRLEVMCGGVAIDDVSTDMPLSSAETSSTRE